MILNPHFLYSIIVCFQRVLFLIHSANNNSSTYIKIEIINWNTSPHFSSIILMFNFIWWVRSFDVLSSRPNMFRIVFPLVLPQIYWKFGLLVLWFLFKLRKFERFAAWTDHDVVILLCSFRHGSKGRAFLLYICSSSSNTKKDNTCESLGVRTNWR